MRPASILRAAWQNVTSRRRIPEARAVGRATLRGWKLVERLYADIERSRGSRVEGVLYLVTKTELHRLDLYEGYPSVYNCVKVIVHAELMGSRAIRYRVSAFIVSACESCPLGRTERNRR